MPRTVGAMKQLNTILVFAACLLCALPAPDVQAKTYTAGPDDYLRMVSVLSPGDTLQLAGGNYLRGLRIHGLEGKGGAPITIAGATEGQPTVFFGRQGNNTISIKNAAYITVRDLELDGRGAFVDAVKAEGDADYAHHITLENLHIHNYALEQQSVGISTKCPAWDWVVRDNRIVGTGTGMYFGNSDGSAPFIGGLIEGNEVVDSIGYNLQIKHQVIRPALVDMPVEPRMTIVRRNRFIKGLSSSDGSNARPNLLVGHFPLHGPGENDEYAIYGNLFFQNPGEALFQGEGNIALYSNLFFNSHDNGFPAVAIQPHNDVPRKVRVFFNTVVHPSRGIRVLRRDDRWVDGQWATGNAVFADTPIQGVANTKNLTGEYTAVSNYLKRPVSDLRELDFSPRGGELLGSAIDLSAFNGLPDFDRDFAGVLRNGRSRGGYVNPGSR